MQPNPVLRYFAVIVVVVAYLLLFGALLVDTLDADKAFEPDDFTRTVTPLLAGALGLVLAAALGVQADTRSLTDFFKSLLRIEGALLLGAILYLLSAVVGGYVWWKQGGIITPDVVKTVVLAVVGYLVATVAALARP